MGWKLKLLSMVERITLTQLVVQAIPLYTMQSLKMPNLVCEKLDRKSKAFLWGDNEERRRVHMVSWDDICKPKGMGGLGLRKAKTIRPLLQSLVGGIS